MFQVMNPTTDREPVDGFVEAPDGRLHHLDWGGGGPQIHFLHANGFCAGTYTPFLRYMTADFHVFASDVRGHGGSSFSGAPRISHWDIFADDLKLTIEKAMTPPIIGMGHSLGAVTTSIAAAKHPRLFSALVLIDPVIFPRKFLWRMAALKFLGLRSAIGPARTARKRKRVFKDKQTALRRFAEGRGIFKSWSQDFIEAYLECGLLERDTHSAILKCDPELEAQIFESVPVNVWSYVKKIACPVLVVRGEASETFSRQAAGRIEAVRPEFELREIPRSGHFVPMEQPQACARVILEFLRNKMAGDVSAMPGRSSYRRDGRKPHRCINNFAK
jgi:pimeloyl-ACP methyl ester carboxylesterase